MVVIPLLSALYDMPVEEARLYVQWSTAEHRATDEWLGGMEGGCVHLPETEEQWRTVQQVQPVVRHHKR